MAVILFIVIAIVLSIVVVVVVMSKSKQIIAQSSQPNPVINCYGGEYEQGKVLLFRPCILNISDNTIRLTNKSGEELNTFALDKTTLKQGGLTNPSKIEITDGTRTYWVRPFSSLFSDDTWYMALKYIYPARNAITKALVDHGAKVSPDSVKS